MWTCIAVTCCDPLWAKALRHELSIFHERKQLYCQTPCLVLEDPAGTVGSGGATLNALLVIVERLCSSKGFSTITSDVLDGANILIIHHGRDTSYWPGGNPFLPLYQARPNNDGLQTYLEFICTLSQLKQNASPGVWIASTDMILHGNLQEGYNWTSPLPEALLVTLQCAKSEARYCGIVRSGLDSIIHGISYDTSESNVKDVVDIAAGIVYLSTPVAETMLSLSSMPALDCCTYIGSDNGDQAQQLSLYFDLLAPLYSNVDKDSFISGAYGSSYERVFGLETGNSKKDKSWCRTLLWNKLNHFQIRAFSVKGLRHCYWTDQLPMEDVLPSLYANCGTEMRVLHSCVKELKPSLVAVNSLIETGLDANNEKDLIVVSSSICTAHNRQLNLNGRAFIINVHLDVDKFPEFRLGDNNCIVGYSVRINGDSKTGLSLFSSSDVPTLNRAHSSATVLGLSWADYLKIKGMQLEDLWSPDVPVQSLRTARLFPLTEDITGWRNLLWLQDVSGSSSKRLQSWRSSTRYSMDDFIRMRDPFATLHHLRKTAALAVCREISQWPGSWIPYLRRACAEHWTAKLLEALDQAAVDEDKRNTSRALAAIADLLGCLAGPEAGLRSGPASNKEWLPAFHLLEHVSVEEGVLALAAQRAKWMDTAERLMRASRHYERAVHILIRQTVQSVQTHMTNVCGEETRRPATGKWVEVECPARLDLSGGWSDTPPICYEMGGSVVNVAILVDGKKPIGVRGRRLETLQLVLVSEGQSDPLVITSVEDVMNYTNPTAPGALLKAALVCAGVVRNDIPLDFSQQLLKTIGGGLELHAWSLLPQGSGLGTSSILASALVAVIYTCMGVTFDRLQLVHAVLYIEQLLTTGGGWQDQVGGVMGGFNRGHSPADVSVQVHVEPLSLTDTMTTMLSESLLLVHTGKVRLARNLLQNVIRQWYSREEQTVISCFRALVENASRCRKALLEGDLKKLGSAIDTYWCQKRIIAPGCEPLFIRHLMDQMAPLVHGQCLAGAGGGGFYFALLKDTSDRRQAEKMIASIQGAEKMVIYSASVDLTGISMTIDANSIPIPY